MLFNSYEFLIFLALVVAAFYGIARWDRRAAKGLLAGASIFFYGWWKASYVALLVGSIAGNYVMALIIRRARTKGRPTGPFVALGVAGNLGLLGYFKYAGFFVDTLNDLAGWGFPVPHIMLPLAISFFTFQQIAFLVDTARDTPKSYDFLDYVLFVTFFPQLIAGPIVHHREMLPQFARVKMRAVWVNISIGLTIFILGLFKKVALADEIAPYADIVFNAAAVGHAPTLAEAWLGSLAYTLQIYFDFSGYSDMAVGLARMFGIRLPVNFFSPYKATSIIDFWRRWHITLSRFLRDYLYIPLGGSRQGRPRRFINLAATMLLGGLWHGAGWTFIIWGGLHGAFLIVNHAWRGARVRLGWGTAGDATVGGIWAARILTFFCVVIAWMFFRAADLGAALAMLEGAAGFNGCGWGCGWGFSPALVEDLSEGDPGLLIALGVVLCWAAPNTVEIMRRTRPVLDPTGVVQVRPVRQNVRRGLRALIWRPSPGWALVMGALGIWAVLHLARVSPFLYFQF